MWPNLGTQVENHGDAVLGLEFPDTRPHGMVHCRGAEARYQKTICEASACAISSL
jgi:hypothetical protein